MKPALRLALLAACLAAQPVHAGQAADKHAKPVKKHTAAHTHKPATAHTHTHTHTSAHAAPHKAANKNTHAAAHKVTHKPAHETAHKPAHPQDHKLAHEFTPGPVHDTAQKAAHAALHTAAQPPALAASPPPKPLRKPPAANPDPHGEGFLNLYVELCVKRIGEIDAFRDKLLREKVPKLQPDSAKLFLSGMEGDAWPVPYQGKMGNFVLVLPEKKNLCMLYARRTDTAAVEQGFAEMVAKPPEPMIATRGPQDHSVTRTNGDTRTVSTSWAPPGSARKMQFMLTTTSAPGAQVQAFGSVAIVVGTEPGPGPDPAGVAPRVTRRSSGSPAPTPRTPAQP